MLWQDIVMGITSIGFSYSLIPQIVHCAKTHRVDITWQTIIITTTGLFALSMCMFSLNCYFTAITNLITYLCWCIIGIQKESFERN